MNTRSTSLVSKTGKAKSPKYAIVAFRESLTCAIYDIEKLDTPRKKVSGATIKVEVNDGLRKGTIVSTADDFEILLVRLQKVNVTSFFGISKRKIGITNITTHKTQAPNVSIKRSTETQSTKRRRTDGNCTSTRIQSPRSIQSDVPHPNTTNNLISPEYSQLNVAKSDADKPKSSSIDLPSSTLLSDSNLNSQESSLRKSISSITPQSELSSIPSSPLTISTPTRTTNTPSPDSSGGYLLSQDDPSTSDTQNSLPSPYDVAGSFSGTEYRTRGTPSGYLSSQDDSSTSDIQNSLPSPHGTRQGSFSGTEYRTRETPSGYLSSQDDSSTSDTQNSLPSPYDVAGSFSGTEYRTRETPSGYLSSQDDSSTSDIQNSLPSLHGTRQGSFSGTESQSREIPSGYLSSQDDSSTSDTQNSLPSLHGTRQGSFSGTESQSRETPSGYLSSQDDPSTSDIHNSLPSPYDVAGSFSGTEYRTRETPSGYLSSQDDSSTSDIDIPPPSPYDVATPEGSFSGTEYLTRETPSGYLSSQDDSSTSDIYIPPPSPYDVATPGGSFSGAAASNQPESLTRDTLSQLPRFDILHEGSFSEVELLSTISPAPTDTPSTGYLVFPDDSSTSDIQNFLPSLHYITTPERSFCETESRTREIPSGYLSSEDDSSTSDVHIPPPSPYDIATPEGPLSGTATSNQPESLTRDTLSQLSRFDILPEGSFSEVELLSTISPPPTDTPSTGYLVFPDDSSTSDIQNSLPSLHYIATPGGSFSGTECRTRETPSGYLSSHDDSSTSDIYIPPPSPYDIATPEGSFSGTECRTRETPSGYLSSQDDPSTSDIYIPPPSPYDIAMPEGSFSGTEYRTKETPSGYLSSQDDSSTSDIYIPPPSPYDVATPEGSFSGAAASNQPESLTRDILSQTSLVDLLPEGSFSDEVELLSPIPSSPLTPTTPPSTDSTSGYLVFPNNLHNSVPSPHDIATPEGSFCETVSPDPRTSETLSPRSLFDITTHEGLFSDDISTPTDKDCDIHQQLSIIKPLKYTSPTEFLDLEQHPTPFTENNNDDSTNPLYDLPPVPVRQLNTMNELVDKHKSFTPSAATTIPSTTSALPTIPLLPDHHHQATIPHQSSASLRETKPNNVPITDPKFMKLKVIQIMGPNLDTDIIQSRIDDLPVEGAEDKSTPYIISEYILKDALIESHMIPERSLVESDQLPERFAVKLLDRIFTLEELEGRNVYGTHHVTKGALDRRKIAAIDEAVKSIFPGTYHIWKTCVKRINSHIRYVLQKIPQLYKKTPTLSINGNSS